MNVDTKKLAASRRISVQELAHRQQAPSETLRRHEAELIAEMARMAHLDRRRFSGWPRLTVVSDDQPWGFGDLHLRAEVEAVLA